MAHYFPLRTNWQNFPNVTQYIKVVMLYLVCSRKVERKNNETRKYQKSDIISKRSVVYKISPWRRESFSPYAYSIRTGLDAKAKQL